MTTPASRVTRDEAIAFLEGACRNWSRVPKLSEDDIADVASELLRFVSARSLSSDSVSDRSKGVTMDREWFERRAAIEGDLEVGVGYSTVNPTPRDLAAYSEIALKALPQWAQNEIRKARSLSDSVSDGSKEKLGRFDHHPDPAIDFEIEVESLQARLFDAKGKISKPGTEPETVSAVLEDIDRAMSFCVGGDPSAVAAKDVLRKLEQEAKAALDSGTGGQQPVAWRWPAGNGDWLHQTEKPVLIDGAQPLYPAPTEPKARVVSEAKVRELVLKHFTPTRHRLQYTRPDGSVAISQDMRDFCADLIATLNGAKP